MPDPGLTLFFRQGALLVASAFAAGVLNALAGGGTILTYPALLFAGRSAIVANATSTVALWPGAAASLFGYRRDVGRHLGWLGTLLLPSLAGGALGAALLLFTPPRVFEGLAPFLVLFATALFLLQSLLAGRAGDSDPPDAGPAAPAPRRLLLSSLFQFAIATYGGYFGAGIGILMLAVLGFLGLRDIHAANGLKNFFGMCVNGVAAGYFIARGAVDWPAAAVMVAAAMAGGYAGARFAQRIGRAGARWAVVAIGLLVAAVLFARGARG
ncbi:MAG: sulfite exporter TauE/SafE family protein [Planctomycetota bacterium]